MALLLFNGFDELPFEQDWAASNNNYVLTNGRRPESRAVGASGNSAVAFRGTIPTAEVTEMAAGAAVGKVVTSTGALRSAHITFSGTNTDGNMTSVIELETSSVGTGTVSSQAPSGNNRTSWTLSSPGAVFPSLDGPGPAWYYLEFRAKISLNDTGFFEVYVNEALVWAEYNISIIGQSGNTLNTRATSFGRATFGTAATSNTALARPNFDDAYITDGEILGDIRVDTLLPTGDGDLTEWNPGTDNYALVNELNPSMTEFVSTDQHEAVDLYTMQTMPAGKKVRAVQLQTFGNKTDAGTAFYKPVLKTPGGTLESPSVALGTTELVQTGAIEEKAPGDVDWTSSIVNQTQAGIKAIFE